MTQEKLDNIEKKHLNSLRPVRACSKKMVLLQWHYTSGQGIAEKVDCRKQLDFSNNQTEQMTTPKNITNINLKKEVDSKLISQLLSLIPLFIGKF